MNMEIMECFFPQNAAASQWFGSFDSGTVLMLLQAIVTVHSFDIAKSAEHDKE